MKKFIASTLALVAAFSVAAPTFAQQAYERLEGESAMQMASRIGACDSAGIRTARFSDAGGLLKVGCVGGLGAGAAAGAGAAGAGGAGTAAAGGLVGGLGVAGTVALSVAAVAGVAAAASSGGSSTTSTTGTN
ncbi:hypothetical protein [Roseovarius sp. MBR-78]|jgi:hypothetical protein|uniref:hypothetical protein n=1 Tax=Roseovarius sp. MBR-78 TaxID=3156460 RepID=UPI0033955A33